jgi:hypothetical protein
MPYCLGVRALSPGTPKELIMTDIRAQYPAIYAATTLDALDAALERDGEAWFADLTAAAAADNRAATYEGVPTWGEATAAVRQMIDASEPSGDVLSWDTTAGTPADHRVLVRRTDVTGSVWLLRGATDAE